MTVLCAPSSLTIARYPVGDVPPDLETRLLELTLPEGEMAKVYRTCANPRRRDWTGQVITASDADTIVGWGLRWQNGYSRHWALFLFVDPARRREGVGSTLVDASQYRLRAQTRVRGFVHDDLSAAFWSSTAQGRVVAPDYRKPAKPTSASA